MVILRLSLLLLLTADPSRPADPSDHSGDVRCLSCTSVASPELCLTYESCNANEICFTRQILDHNNNWNFRLGCEDRTICQSVEAGVLLGRRQLSQPQAAPCFHCCSENDCNQNLCLEAVSSNPGGSSQSTASLCVNTDGNYHYIPVLEFPTGSILSRVTFQVIACHDAHIGLSNEKANFTHDFYEVVLGGWNNTNSVLRDVMQGIQLAFHQGHVLDCNRPTTFTIEWTASNFRLYREGQLTMFHTHDMLFPRFVSLSTGWNATGSWKLSVPANVIPYLNPDNEQVYSC